MSGMQNLHRITGAVFTHYKPNLCPGCAHFKPSGDPEGWYGRCRARGTTLCCERSEKGRCRDFTALTDGERNR
jgi:hypothetical protein